MIHETHVASLSAEAEHQQLACVPCKAVYRQVTFKTRCEVSGLTSYQVTREPDPGGTFYELRIMSFFDTVCVLLPLSINDDFYQMLNFYRAAYRRSSSCAGSWSSAAPCVAAISAGEARRRRLGGGSGSSSASSISSAEAKSSTSVEATEPATSDGDRQLHAASLPGTLPTVSRSSGELGSGFIHSSVGCECVASRSASSRSRGEVGRL